MVDVTRLLLLDVRVLVRLVLVPMMVAVLPVVATTAVAVVVGVPVVLVKVELLVVEPLVVLCRMFCWRNLWAVTKTFIWNPLQCSADGWYIPPSLYGSRSVPHKSVRQGPKSGSMPKFCIMMFLQFQSHFSRIFGWRISLKFLKVKAVSGSTQNGSKFLLFIYSIFRDIPIILLLTHHKTIISLGDDPPLQSWCHPPPPPPWRSTTRPRCLTRPMLLAASARAMSRLWCPKCQRRLRLHCLGCAWNMVIEPINKQNGPSWGVIFALKMVKNTGIYSVLWPKWA